MDRIGSNTTERTVAMIRAQRREAIMVMRVREVGGSSWQSAMKVKFGYEGTTRST